MTDDVILYSLSANNYGDGKSVCLWRRTGSAMVKIAKFTSDDAARLFAVDFNYPLSDNLINRLYPNGEPK